MMSKATIHLEKMLDTGYCLAREAHLIQGGSRRTVACHSLAALLHHPGMGWLLWDAGYAVRLLAATSRSVFWLYRLATPLRLARELSAVCQLQRQGLGASDVRMILISHFHADHIAGLQDFPEAQLVASQAAYEDVARRRGLNALRRGFIPALLPGDFRERATLLPAFSGPPLPHLGPTHDLFDDGSMLLVGLPGHARGQMGLLANTDRGQILLVADACWLTRSLRERRPPSRISQLIVDDARQLRETIDHLHDFSQSCPDVRIIPTHCPEALEPGNAG
jgi:glyoxylase-like metal-dependent hydrolase (beta-lactamase superfamily II)